MKVTITVTDDSGRVLKHEADALQPTDSKLVDPLKERSDVADWEFFGFTYQPHVRRTMRIRG